MTVKQPGVPVQSPAIMASGQTEWSPAGIGIGAMLPQSMCLGRNWQGLYVTGQDSPHHRHQLYL